jgi:hypothetical protein
MSAICPEEVRQALAAHIEALTPTDGYSTGAAGYAQMSTDAWRESSEPLVPEWEPSSTVHLSFFVDDRDLENTGRARGIVESPHEWPIVVAPVVIRFLFAQRPMARVTDWDGAAKAGRHLLRHVLAEGWQGDGFAVVMDPRPITRRPIGAGDFVSVEVRVRVVYELSLAEAA